MICVKCSQIFELAQKFVLAQNTLGPGKGQGIGLLSFVKVQLIQDFLRNTTFSMISFSTVFLTLEVDINYIHLLSFLPFLYLLFFNQKIPQATDTQWRHKSKISEKLGRCGRHNLLRPYLKIWEWEWIFGCTVQWRLFPLWAALVHGKYYRIVQKCYLSIVYPGTLVKSNGSKFIIYQSVKF